ncbi:MAG: metal ABC transporter substrate-binding protein [Firmicutes bacterium]|nr:metal ABC transporter substrate-binding protein [Bacillota bacterium]
MKIFFKRILVLALSLLLLVPASFSLVGCSRRTPDIVVTIFPFYDWTRVVLGDNPADLKVRYLFETGADLHTFEVGGLTPSVLLDISQTSLFLYNGGMSDEWTRLALANQQNENRVAVPLMRELGVDETMRFPDDSFAGDEDDCCGGATHDEHIWLSPRFATRLIERIRDEIMLLDPVNAAYYYANTEAYIAKLVALDAEFLAAVEDGTRDTIIVADRFPFLYMSNHYGFRFYAAFQGCSAADEISPTTFTVLVDAVNRLSPNYLFIIDNMRFAESLIGSSNASPDVLRMECFQSVSRSRINDGLTYYSAMRQNMESLRRALA